MNQLLAAASIQINEAKEGKGAELLLDTSSSPITLTSHCSDCHSIPKANVMFLDLCSVYLSKTEKKPKNQAGTMNS